jgi:cell division protein FtsW
MPAGSQTSPRDEIETQKKRLKGLCLITFVLVCMGMFNVYSSTVYTNMVDGANPYGFLIRHLASLVVGLFVFFFCKSLRPERLRSFCGFFCFCAIILLIMVPVFGISISGARRWIVIGPLSIQPSELAKVPAIMWAAAYLAQKMDKGVHITVFERLLRPIFKRNPRVDNTFGGVIRYFKPLIIPAVMSGLVLMEPDMGTAGMILAFPCLLYILAGMPKKEIVVAIVLSVAFFFLIALISPYRAARLATVWDPFADPEGGGFQVVQSLIAVGSGGLFGLGPGQGFSKFNYLPEKHTDFAFAILSQEWGFIGSALIVFLFIAFIVLGLRMAQHTTNTYRMLLTSGLTLMIGTQGMLNMAMVIGCFPVTGVPLPFISYGGTSLLVNLAAVGMIVGAVRSSIREQERMQRMKLAGYDNLTPHSLAETSGAVFHVNSR